MSNEILVYQFNKKGISEERQNDFFKILEAFDKQGHSGFSASYAIGYIKASLKDEKVKEKLNKSLTDNTDEMQNMMVNDIFEILNLMEEFKFDKVEKKIMCRILSNKPIIPLTGADDEWEDCTFFDDGGKTQRNKLCTAIFRENRDNSTATYLYGKSFSDNGGVTWFTGNITNKLRSKSPIKFPFYPPDHPKYIYLNGENSRKIINKNKYRREQLKVAYEEKMKVTYGE